MISAADKLEETFTAEDKGQLVGHLWNVRHDSSILKGEPWLGKDVIEWMKQQGYTVQKIGNQWRVTGFDTYVNDWFQSLNDVAVAFQHNQALSPQQNRLTSTANTALMPDGVRMVPAWVIATLLVAYVLAIGPLDYWLLGLLKARKFTWILFPVTTAFFTGLTIMIAHGYMSSTETGGQVSIIDVVDDGRLVRETSLQMNFYGASTIASSKHKQAFYVPAAMSDTTYVGFSNDSLPSTDKKVINLSGRFPQNYQSEVSLSQWDPFLTRTFRLQPEVDRIPEINWNNADLVTSAQGRQKLATQLNNWETQDDLLTVDAIVMHQSQIHRIQADRPTQIFDSSITRRSQLQAERNMYCLLYTSPSPRDLSTSRMPSSA